MSQIIRIAVLLALLVALCGCGLDMSRIDVGPGNTVSWEDAKTIIRRGNVDYVAQTHALQVTIGMEDGTRYQTTEPDIDGVFDWVRACGKEDSIGIITE